VTYIHQGDPKGLAHAVLCAREFLGDEPFVMYLGDNLLQEGTRSFVAQYVREPCAAVVGVTPVAHPSSYGVVELRGEEIVSIVEKPTSPRSNLALIGVYLFSPKIHAIIDGLKPSARGELEITDAIWKLHEAGNRVVVRKVEGWWKDTGRPEDLLEANDRVLESRAPESFERAGMIDPSARIVGKVGLGSGSSIGPGVSVEGPCVIGSGTRIDGRARLGPGTSIGDRCVLRDCTVERAILMEGASVEGRLRLTNSIVGRGAAIRSECGEEASLSCILGDSTVIRLA
jgi:glucose-1-phosphate thymidylyltransferase